MKILRVLTALLFAEWGEAPLLAKTRGHVRSRLCGFLYSDVRARRISGLRASFGFERRGRARTVRDRRRPLARTHAVRARVHGLPRTARRGRPDRTVLER